MKASDVDVNNLVIRSNIKTVNGTSLLGSGDIVTQVLPYKVYTAIVSQTAGGIPTAMVLENTLGGEVTWYKQQVGFFIIRSTGLFTLDKTVLLSSTGLNYEDSTNYNITWDAEDINSISLYTTTDQPIDDLLRKSLIEIRVYN
ncbi:hypothetical protein D3C85_1457620 [compost metagenome]